MLRRCLPFILGALVLLYLPAQLLAETPATTATVKVERLSSGFIDILGIIQDVMVYRKGRKTFSYNLTTGVTQRVRRAPTTIYKSLVLEKRIIIDGYGKKDTLGGVYATEGTTSSTKKILPAFIDPFNGFSLELIGVAGKHVIISYYTPQIGVQPWATDGTSRRTFLIGKYGPEGSGGGIAIHLSSGIVEGKLYALVRTAGDSPELPQSLLQVTPKKGGVKEFAINQFLPSIKESDVAFQGFTTPDGLKLFTFEGYRKGERGGALPARLSIVSKKGKRTTLINKAFITDFPNRGCASQCEEEIPQDSVNILDFVRNINSKLFFYRWTPEIGLEPWVSDGTKLGTKLLADLNPGPKSSVSHFFDTAELNGRLYWRAPRFEERKSRVWSTDGTPEGTQLVLEVDHTDPFTGELEGIGFGGDGFVTLGNYIYFLCVTGYTPGESPLTSICRTNGTPGHKEVVYALDENELGIFNTLRVYKNSLLLSSQVGDDEIPSLYTPQAFRRFTQQHPQRIRRGKVKSVFVITPQ